MSLKTNVEPMTEMEEKPSLAVSLPVPYVQEMVKKNPSQVPERYVRSHEEMEKVNHMPHLSSEIPIIDLALLSYGNTEELLKLGIACEEWGFFQLINHGVQKELMQRMKDAAAEFFNLPMEEKEKYAMPSNDIQGYGHPYVASEDQILDWTDTLMLRILPTQYRKLSLWPKTPEGFKEMIEAYSSDIKRVGEELISFLSLTLGLQKHDFLGLHKELSLVLNLNYYPPCNTPEQVMGLSAHSDVSTITLLMQDDDVSGLEIRHKGAWVPVTPISDALVVNVGDVLEIWSNGKYKSIEHRVLTNKKKGRTSHVYFCMPSDDVEVEPFDHMIDAENPKLYKKVRFDDFLKKALNRKIEGKTHLDPAKIKE